ncbi:MULTISPECIES: aldehyde dehydrogenase family protein [Streptomyces]|uniref:Aldehyde dehydrogenase family protein n=1 Tax=Streptomyces cinereoruber TaxID=67260 RepID=A0ABX6BL76_9ACTN|nr:MULTISPECIES: aldehyde dehydrogenase family protein [Streptomyces]AVH94192.1 aldehyde dehydrogenase [Streptomyces sp. WAC00288]KYG51385.1 aldehyde dehydrogenase [Streptomyces sp. WAC04657]MBB4162304.1 acyl-CoA reductase-like NAD-dependent aldehyde dehydrogenase [Streptomyces cinereoruber]MBY8820094.1 aldehyde dehydrogenase family protein [Streptomyces cinereoruber]NIH63407.1 acyl-CoA reductase-like NAD-dependent aldehyde dehydrogenase [Streptomyces cinereoruber]
MPEQLIRVEAVGAAESYTGRGDLLALENPATGTTYAEVREADEELVDQVVAGAAATYRNEWSTVEPLERARLMLRWADVLMDHQDELARIESTDVGHLYRESAADVGAAARWLRYFAGVADKIEGQSVTSHPDRSAFVTREPYGVVAGVNSFNGNMLMFGMKAAPALATGNCFVLKAPELGPLSSFRMAELAVEAGIPRGVVSVVSGRGHITGPALVAHPEVGMVMFTGGLNGARGVIESSAVNIKPLTLELGGKNAVVLLDDVDLDRIVPHLLHSNFVKCGQSCAAGSRVFVPRRLADELAGRMAEAARLIRPGDPFVPSSDMGAIISEQQVARVEDLVRRAVEGGAAVLAGGRRAETGPATVNGHFFEPTVLADLDDGNIAAREEIFGPVVGLLTYDGLDEVVARANGLDFGLTAQIWGDDVGAVHHLTRGIEAGTVWVNTYRSIHPSAPYGGFKHSGYGRENGAEVLKTYTRAKTTVWNHGAARHPYGDLLEAPAAR